MEIDMTYKLKVMQQNLEQEEAEHKATKARLADKNKIYESIEEAKSEAMKGMHTILILKLCNLDDISFIMLIVKLKFIRLYTSESC